MGKQHLKPNYAPPTWHIQRKLRPYVVRPRPGGHPLRRTLPVGMILRDLLFLATSMREVRYILANNEVLINGVRVWTGDSPMGFMDILHIPAAKISMRTTFNIRGKIVLEPVTEATVKLSKITDKLPAKGGRVQLTCFDGRTILVDAKQASNYKPGHTLLLSLPSQQIKSHIPLIKGASVLLYGGQHIGSIGKIESITGNTLQIKNQHGTLETKTQFAIALP